MSNFSRVGYRGATPWVLLAIVLLTGPGLNRLRAQSCFNPTACENALPGNNDWDVDADKEDQSIQGFATDISVNAGSTVSFKIKTNASKYVLNIYRLGYYGGDGARKVATVNPSVSLPQSQPASCLTNATTGLVDCGNWSVSASWDVPANAVSGVYLANAKRTDTGGVGQIFFIVRNDAGHSDVLYVTSDET